MEKEKYKVLIQFLLIFRQSGDVVLFFYARRLRGYTATATLTFSLSAALYWMKQLFRIETNFVKNGCSFPHEHVSIVPWIKNVV